MARLPLICPINRVIAASILLVSVLASVAAPSVADESVAVTAAAFESPGPADDRCGEFGWNPAVQSTVPVAWPQIMDLSQNGVLRDEAVRLADSTAGLLAMTGAFRVLGQDVAPTGGAITWISPLAFDYLGWRQAGAWMVVTGTLAPEGEGRVRVTLMAFLTEEGDVLQVSNSSALIPSSELTGFAGRFVEAISACITGVPGMLDTRIVYARKAPGSTKEIWITEAGSGQQRQVSRDGALAVLPAWGPGGSIAWTGYAAGNPDIYLDGKRFGDRPGMNTGIAFAPDGSFAAVTWAKESSSDIFLIDPRNGREIARLTNSPADDMSPSWSPDSERIAFISDRLGFPGIFVMNRDGTGQQALPLPGNYNTGPDWSPDGTKIAWQSRGEGSRFSIWTYDLVTDETRKLSRDRYNNEEPSWSSDGRFIVYTSTRDGRKSLYIMNADGTNARPLLNDEADYFTPAWERRIPALPR